MSEFFQDPPQLGNQFRTDRLLEGVLRRLLPAEVHSAVEPDLVRFGDRVVGDIAVWGEDAHRNEPYLVPYDAWGRRIDEIVVARGWREQDRISAQEGIVALGYERPWGAASRLVQFARLYLYHPSSALYSCPLAMTDGAARLIEVQQDSYLLERAWPHLVSRDPAEFWTSGQWMTERSGGSDVGGTETVARPQQGRWHRLYGTKWFTSATTSQMAMTLARIEDAQGRTTPGSRGLSLFYLETRDEAGRLNDLEILRLKDKLGTRSLPTAELRLAGTRAYLVGEPGQGVRNIAALMNITRMYNATCSLSGMRRGLALARDYAGRRRAFGKLLADHPLHLETLARLEVDLAGAMQLVFHAVQLLGKEEVGQASDDERAILRLLTPVNKLFLGKLCVAAASEVLESFGGAGYVEDTGLPRLLRDAQVTAIWEGTTNVLSLDTLRAIQKEEAFGPWAQAVKQRIAGITLPEVAADAAKLGALLGEVIAFLPRALAEDPSAVETGARDFALALGRVTAGSLLLEHAQWSAAHCEESQARRDVAIAQRWCRGPIAAPVVFDAEHRQLSRLLALDEAAARETVTN